MFDESPSRNLRRVALIGGSVLGIAILGGCPDYSESEPVSMEEAGGLVAEHAPKNVEVDSNLIGMIDEVLTQMEADPTGDYSAAEEEMREIILAYPETKHIKEITDEYDAIMARFDVVISLTRTPEARAPLGKLKRAANLAFEEAISAEHERGGDDAEREMIEQQEAEAKAKAEAEAAEAAADAEAEAAAEAVDATADAG